MNFILKLYTLLLRLYPAAFQRRFGEEMQGVFSESLEEAQRAGSRQQFTHVLKEIADFPRGLWQIYFASPQPMLTPALEPLSSGGPPRLPQPRATWIEALLGGLPQFLLALLVGLPMVLSASGLLSNDSILSIILIVLALLTLIASVVLNFRLGKPRWAAAWYFYWFVAANLIFGMIHDIFSPIREWSEVVTYPHWSTLFGLLFVYVLYRITARDRLRGLLAAVPIIMVVWSINLEFVPDGPEGINWLTTSILAGLISMLLLRANRVGTGTLLVVALTALAGLPFAYLGIYMGGMLSYTEPGPSLRAVWNSYTPILGVTAAIALGPQLAVTLREIGRRCERLGRVAYRVALAGLLLAITANLILVSSITNDSTPFFRTAAAVSVIKTGFGLGITVYVAGFFLLLSALHRNQPHLIDAGRELLLLITALGVPFVVLSLLSAIGGFHLLPAWLPEAIHPSSETLLQINVWFHPVWVVLSVWTVNLWLKRLSPEQT